MANEARLNLVISAKDEAKAVIEGFANSIKETFSGLQEEMARAFNMSPIEGSVSEAAATIQRSFSELNIGTILEEQFRSLNQAVSETTRAVEDGFTQMAESARTSSEEIVTALGQTKQATEDVGGMIAAQMIGDQLKQIGEKGKSAFEEAISSASDFEFNMSRIGAVLTTVGKASNSQMQQMSEMALSLGSHSSFSANQIAEGMYTLA